LSPKKVGLVSSVAVLSIMLAGPITVASASGASIRAAIQSYNSKVLVAEGHLLSAIGKYKKHGDPVPVRVALDRSIAVLSSLKAKIASQSASSPRVKKGKAKFEQGLRSVIVAYRHLKRAFGEKQSSPQTAKAQAAKALRAVKKGQAQIKEGARLLS
jgi:hypothetical protein